MRRGVSCWIALACQRHRPVAGIVVDPVACVQSAMLSRAGFITQLCVDQSQVVMGRRILRIERERLFELLEGLPQEVFANRAIGR